MYFSIKEPANSWHNLPFMANREKGLHLSCGGEQIKILQLILDISEMLQPLNAFTLLLHLHLY